MEGEADTKKEKKKEKKRRKELEEAQASGSGNETEDKKGKKKKRRKDNENSDNNEKKRREIDKILHQISQTVGELQQKRQKIKADPECKMLETSEMIVSVKLLSGFVQKLKDNLLRKTAKKNNFEELPSGSESEFEGVIEPTKVAVGNLHSTTTREDLIGFFAKAGHATSVEFQYDPEFPSVVIAALVEFETSEEANEAVKLNGEDLNDNTLYITHNGNNRKVFFARANSKPNQSELMMRKTIQKVFCGYGSVFNVYFPPNERFAYVLVDFFDGSASNLERMERLFNGHRKGIFIRPANLKGSFGEEHLDV